MGYRPATCNWQSARGSWDRHVVILLWLLGGPLVATAEQFDFFEQRIRPLLVEHCYRCHSESSEKLKGGLRLDTRAGIRQGGDSGRPAVVPGRAQESLMVEAIRYSNEKLQMPPKGRLSEGQVNDVVRWINAGAPDPRTNAGPALEWQRSGATGHWAFQPPRARAVPSVRQATWPRTPIDAYVLARLEQAGLQPAPRADKRTLLRRVSYDLTGLPPSPAEVTAFEVDESKEAFAKVVDHLLASPHYGERWGRHWLDVARYSDTKGYVYDREEKQFVHSHVYRDWVIRAFNQDLPYDQFLLEQIAGDQPSPGSAVASGYPDLAALGFLTVGRRFLGVKHDIIDDRIDVLTRGTMGLTVACARCHDHKYDPVSMRDYYSLYGVFNSSTEQTVALMPVREQEQENNQSEFWKGLRQRQEKLQSTFQKKRAELAARLRARTADYLAAVLEAGKLPSEEFYAIMSADDLNPVVVRQWESYLFKHRTGFDRVFGLWHAWAGLPRAEFPQRSGEILRQFQQDPARAPARLILDAFNESPTSMQDVVARYGKVFADVDHAWRNALAAASNSAAAPNHLEPDREIVRQILYGADSPATVPNGAIIDIEWFFDEPTRVELAKLQAEIDRWIIKSPDAVPHAVILADRPVPKNARILLRGNPANPGAEVPRRFLEVFGHSGSAGSLFTNGSGRYELARAIASRENPLTARVMVNRIWQHHFGAGLVRTPSDFGLRAEAPSHPELLDWLAVRFMDHGWSIKQLQRLILLSAVYQQASDPDPGAKGPEVDPANRLLWRMNKQHLDFEGMRDSLLAVTGELDQRLGGRPVDLFAKIETTRRSVYGMVDRQFVPGVLRVFDFANPDLHIPQRSDTTVPQQALFFMNNPFTVQRARVLASRVAGVPEGAERVRGLYRLAYQREPTPSQIDLGREFVRDAFVEPRPVARPAPATAWRYGYGKYDPQSGRITRFDPLPHFTGAAWQGGAQWPDTKLGWVQLTAEGGHAGNDLDHAAIRRWIAPKDGAISIGGTVEHAEQAGDGVTARIVSSHHGELGLWNLHNAKADVNIERVEVRRGDSIDFVVDLHNGLNSDMFKWAPVLKSHESDPPEWSAKKDFSGPPIPPPPPLSPWEKYAQVLLQANEFFFID